MWFVRFLLTVHKKRMNTINGSCYDLLPRLPPQSIDLILCDPPFGLLGCSGSELHFASAEHVKDRDESLDWPRVWPELRRVIRPDGAIVLFAGGRFVAELLSSNPDEFRYCWVWVAEKGSNHLNCKTMPRNLTQLVTVFGLRGCPRYFPVKEPGEHWVHGQIPTNRLYHRLHEHIGPTRMEKEYWPVDLLCYKRDGGLTLSKPVALMRYLVTTYSQPGETVLDFTMGSGSTGMACFDRNFIGFEIKPSVFAIAKQRLSALTVTGGRINNGVTGVRNAMQELKSWLRQNRSASKQDALRQFPQCNGDLAVARKELAQQEGIATGVGRGRAELNRLAAAKNGVAPPVPLPVPLSSTVAVDDVLALNQLVNRLGKEVIRRLLG